MGIVLGLGVGGLVGVLIGGLDMALAAGDWEGASVEQMGPTGYEVSLQG